MCLNKWDNNNSGWVSLRYPFLLFVNGVLTARQITTSSSLFGLVTLAAVLFYTKWFFKVLILSIIIFLIYF